MDSGLTKRGVNRLDINKKYQFKKIFYDTKVANRETKKNGVII